MLRTPGLRARLYLLVAFFGLLCTAAILFVGYSGVGRTLEAGRTTALSLANQISRQHAALIGSALGVLRTAASVPLVGPGNVDACPEVMRRLETEFTEYVRFSVTDPEGKIV